MISATVGDAVIGERRGGDLRALERALKESDQRFCALVLALSQIVFRVSPDGTPIENTGWFEVTGQTIEELEQEGWSGFIHPKDLTAVEALWTTSIRTAVPFQATFRLRTKDRGYRWFRAQAVPVIEAGVVREWIGMTADVHEQRRTEEALIRANSRLHTVITMQAEVAAVGMERTQIMRCVSERLRDLVGADIAAVAVPAGDDFEYPVMIGKAVPDVPPRLHRNASLTGWCFEQAQSVKSDDIISDARASTSAQDILGVRALLLVPVLVKGKPVAVLSALSRRPHAFDEEDLSVLELLAGILGAALATAGAHEERQLLLAERTAALVRSTRSEELFRALTEHSDEIIYISEQDGTIRYVSPSLTRVLGKRPEEVQGSSALEAAHPEDRPILAASFAEIVGEAGRSNAATVRVRHKNGSWRYLEFTGRNLAHVPAIAGIAANARDVTERVEAARAIEFQAQLLQTVEQAVIATDMVGNVIYWNQYAETLYGWTAAEAMGRSVRELTVDSIADARANEIMRSLIAGESWRGEFALKRRDGSTFTGYVIDTPIYGADGGMTGIVGVSSDISDRRQLEDQLRQSQKMEAVGELAGGVAHDFNNMLTAITSYSELLLQDEVNEGKRTDLLEIKGAARRAAELTKKLLAFSRRQVMQVQVMEVGEVLRGLEKMLSRVIHENILLDTSYPADAVFIEADASALEQVILNLVVNARDALPEGGTIRVQLQSDGESCVLRVSDDGIGMNEETRARIFEPFFTTKPAGKGTGLGLSVVYGIVQQSRGSIDVASTPGEGTTFTIRLPLSHAAAALATATPKEGATSGSETIVVAEDNPMLVELARRILEGEGYRVLCAGTAAEVLTMLAGGMQPDLLITDVIMADMRGPELVQRLDAAGVRPRVLYMSGYATDACDDCSAREHSAFLAKPWTPRDLSLAVRTLLG